MVLASCGFKPLYQQDDRVLKIMDQIQIATIDHRDGQLLRNALISKMHRYKGLDSGPRPRLVVEPVFSNEHLGVTTSASNALLRITATVRFKFYLPDETDPALQFRITRAVTIATQSSSNAYATQTSEETSRKHLSESISEEAFNRIALYLGAGA
ncbi:MAG: LPS assembly lipoprotein LptE [Pseudomonadota bacterium]